MMRRCFSFPQPSTPPATPDGIRSSSGEATDRSPSTFKLTSLEYSRTIETRSFQEIWSSIHSSPPLSPSSLLRPDAASVYAALRDARPSALTSHASDLFDYSERTSRLCLSLQHSVHRARLLYDPLHSLLDVLPDPLSPDHSSAVFDALLQFHASDNPFPTSDFDDVRRFFAVLRPKLQSLLDDARRKRQLLRRVTEGSAVCLIAATVGIAIAGFIVATHGLAALAMAPMAGLKLPGDLLERRKERARQELKGLEDALEGTYVVDYLETIRCLVTALRSSVESDLFVAGVGVRQGRERGAMEEVVKHIRKNQKAFIKGLTELEEHVCICCTAVNRSRSRLLEHVHLRSRHSSSRSTVQ